MYIYLQAPHWNHSTKCLVKKKAREINQKFVSWAAPPHRLITTLALVHLHTVNTQCIALISLSCYIYSYQTKFSVNYTLTHHPQLKDRSCFDSKLNIYR